MTSLKRSASFAFGTEDVANHVDRVPATQSAPTSPRKRSSSQPRSSSSRRAVVPRSPILRRVAGDVLSATTYRAIKRQRTIPPEEWNDGWQLVTFPLETGEMVQKLVMVSSPSPPTPTPPPPPAPAQNFIVATTCRLLTAFGFGLSTAPAVSTPDLPHLAEPQGEDPSQDWSAIEQFEDTEMDVVCEEEEEAHVFSLVRPEVPSLPPSPLAAYTPLQWALLSRYPHLVQNALSTKRNKSRSAHVQFIASRYSKEANPNFHPPTPRKTSPLAASPPMTLAPRRLTKTSRPMQTERLVRAAQTTNAPPSRWANYPTCSAKYPGPDGPGTMRRNALLLNFGSWLRENSLWTTVQVGSIRRALAWFEYISTKEEEEDGTVTPTVSSPTGSVANLHEFTFDTEMQ